MFLKKSFQKSFQSIQENFAVSDTFESNDDELLKKTSDYESDNGNLEPVRTRSMQQRMFGPMKRGSLRGSALILFQTAVGAGALSLPSSSKSVGIIGEFVVMIMCCCILYWVLYTLGRISIRVGANSQPDLILRITKSKILVYLWQTTILGYSIGSIAFQQKLAGNTIQIVLDLLIDFKSFSPQVQSYTHVNQFILSVAIISFLFCMLKDLTKFQILGKISLFAMFYISIMLCFQIQWKFDPFTDNLKQFSNNTNDQCENFTTCLFAFNSVLNIFTSTQALSKPERQRVKKAIIISKVTEFVLYTTLVVGGQLCFRENTPSNILEAVQFDTQNQFLIFGNMLFVLVLIFGSAVNCYPGRNCLFEFIHFTWGKDYSDDNNMNVIVTFVFVVLAQFICTSVADILNIVNIIAGMFGIQFSIILPMIIYIKFYEGKYLFTKIFVVCVGSFCSYLAFNSSQINILKVIQNF